MFYNNSEVITDKEECYFYHTIDLKSGETVYGNWDLRGRENEYLGGVEFKDKNVLDVGASSGSLTWTMEDWGAQVISLDIGPGATMFRDSVPWAGIDYIKQKEHINKKRFKDQKFRKALSDNAQLNQKNQEFLRELEDTKRGHPLTDSSDRILSPYVPVYELTPFLKGYWYCHHSNNSNAKVIYRSAYEIPREIGPLDYVVFGSILLHLRDPFFALHNGVRLAKEKVIVTDRLHSKFKNKKK